MDSIDFLLRRIVEVSIQIQESLETMGGTETALQLVRNQQSMSVQIEMLLANKLEQPCVHKGIVLR